MGGSSEVRGPTTQIACRLVTVVTVCAGFDHFHIMTKFETLALATCCGSISAQTRFWCSPNEMLQCVIFPQPQHWRIISTWHWVSCIVLILLYLLSKLCHLSRVLPTTMADEADTASSNVICCLWIQQHSRTPPTHLTSSSKMCPPGKERNEESSSKVSKFLVKLSEPSQVCSL